MSWVSFALATMVICDVIAITLLITYIAKLHKDVEYLKKKMVQVESKVELARSTAYLARRCD